ncbi:amidase signature enzyme [Athelia psychrophila]|uniref:Amidase signature enzyme n=1 Tax=Athelia psychrophila TaxID=1759441 RepID=A0A166SPC6_9AGAM|nr:amidase signature enzyme [Fibularhizoctonia sp. CBS 109695]
MSNLQEHTNAKPKFYNYPTPKYTEHPYQSPEDPKNPVVRGPALNYAASIISSVTAVQTYLWNNTGFNRLQGKPELDNVVPRYDPTVIPIEEEDAASAPLDTEACTNRVPSRDSAGRFYSVYDYHEAYKSHKLTPTAVVEALLPLIRRDVQSPSKHSIAWLETRVDLVQKAAEASTQRYKDGKPLGVLDGVPVAVKDEVDMKGYKKTLGTKRDLTSKDDVTSFCVTKWEEAGAINLGKLTMHELGLDTTNNNPNHGTPLNPYNPHYYTGGSSGGSGYAVGAGLIPFALGADAGGSIRIPSNYCGIFGLKTSHGRVSGAPTPSLASTTDVLGPMAANMADLAIAYHTMAQPDPSNPTSALFPTPKPLSLSTPRKKVLGIYKTWFDRADAPVRALCQSAIDHLTGKLGYEVVDISIPLIHEGQSAHALTVLSEIGSSFPDVTGLTAPNKVLISVGLRAQSADFLAAQKLRHILMQHLAALWQTHPGMVIVTPVTPNAGWHIAAQGDLKYGVSDGNMSIRSMEYVWMANFTGCPALSCPVGYADAKEGEGKIPVGLMGMGEWGSEANLIEWGFDGEAWLNNGLEGGRKRSEAWVDVLGLAGEK